MKLLQDTNVQVGDVLFVQQQFIPEGQDTAINWKWFGVVTQCPSRHSKVLHVIRLGDDAARVRKIRLHDFRFVIQLLDDDEWPEGVVVLRTRLMLEGHLGCL